jgi:hypothetical protein
MRADAGLGLVGVREGCASRRYARGASASFGRTRSTYAGAHTHFEPHRGASIIPPAPPAPSPLMGFVSARPLRGRGYRMRMSGEAKARRDGGRDWEAPRERLRVGGDDESFRVREVAEASSGQWIGLGSRVPLAAHLDSGRRGRRGPGNGATP